MSPITHHLTAIPVTSVTAVVPGCVFPLFLHLCPGHERRLFAGLRLGDVNGYRPGQRDHDLVAD